MLVTPLISCAGESASGTCGDEATWVLDDQGVLTVSGSGFISSHPWDAASVTKVIVQSGITGINSYVFRDCSSATEFVLPDGITTIYGEAFPAGYPNIKSRIGSDTAKALGVYGHSFREEQSDYHLALQYSEDASSLRVIHADSVAEIYVPDGVTHISNMLFMGNTALESIRLPDQLKALPTRGFDGCTQLKSVSIPAGITCIPNLVFANCKSLSRVSIPDSVLTIEASAFKNCSALRELTLPGKIKNILNNAFDGCTNLSSITFPESVISLGTGAFTNCTSLTRVVFQAKTGNANFKAGENVFPEDTIIYCYQASGLDTHFTGYDVKFLDYLEIDSIRVISLPEDFSMACGESCTLSPYVFPADGAAIEWKCSNTNVLSVSDGTVTALRAGLATVTASIGKIEDTITITVNPCQVHTPVTDPAVSPTCTETGLTEGSHCSVCGLVITAQEVVSAFGHNWDEPTYQWSEDHSEVTATRICRYDVTHSHTKTETVSAMPQITKPATCEQPEEITYSCCTLRTDII